MVYPVSQKCVLPKFSHVKQTVSCPRLTSQHIEEVKTIVDQSSITGDTCFLLEKLFQFWNLYWLGHDRISTRFLRVGMG